MSDTTFQPTRRLFLMAGAAAEILRLEAWRDPDGVLRRALRPTGPREHGWHDLLGANLSDARDAAAIIGRLGGHPILVHGVRRDRSCTCGCCPSRPRWR